MQKLTNKTILIKVGTKPWTIQLNNIKLMRAFNMMAVEKLVNIDGKVDACILYDINEEDKEETIRIVGENSKKYLIYCEELTESIVDIVEKTGIEYVQSEESLFDALKVSLGLLDEKDLNNPFKLVSINTDDDEKKNGRYIKEIERKLEKAEKNSADNLEKYNESKKKLDGSIEDIKQLKEEIDRLNKDTESSGIKLQDAESEVNELKEKIAELEKGLSDSKEDSERLEELAELLDSKELALQENIDLIVKANETVDSIKEELENIKKERDVLKGVVEEKESSIVEHIDNIHILREERVGIEVECNTLKIEVEELSKKLEEQLNKKDGTQELRDELEKKLEQEKQIADGLLKKIDELEEVKSNLENKLQLFEENKNDSKDKENEEINKLNIEIAEITAERSKTEMELSAVRSLLESESKKAIELKLELDTHKTGGEDAGIYKKKLKALEGLNMQLMSTIEINKQTEESYRNKVEELTRDIRTLETGNVDLQTKVESLGMLADRRLTNSIKLSYKGKAKVIQAYGSGSYGVTSVAISIANRLANKNRESYRVAFIDFDVVSPKADAWFGRPPIVKGIAGLKDGSIMNTGLGILLEEGVDFWIANRSDIVINAAPGKCNEHIDYISGLYSRVEISTLAMSELSEFMSYIGNVYDYIVIDCGRVGGSDLQTSIIKAINEIGSRDVLVSLNNSIDSRSLLLRVKESKLNYSNQAWILNLSKTSKIEKSVRDVTRENETFLFPRDASIYGEYTPFDRVNILKDRVNSLVDFLTNK